jgi:RND family efflux transporter MFP subunit
MAEREPVISGVRSARVRRAKARRRLFINIAAAVVVIAAIVGVWWLRRSPSRLPEGLVTATAQRMDLVQTISATGSVTAQTGAMVKIGSQITGRIKRLFADVGDHMDAGEVIAELDVPDLEAQVRQAEATLALNRTRLAEQLSGVSLLDTQTVTDVQKAEAGVAVAQASLRQVQQSADLQLATAQAGVRQAQANATNADANLRRVQQVFDQGFIAHQELDSAKAQGEVAAAQLASAQENVKLVQAKVSADLASAREQLKQARAVLAAARAGTSQQAIKRHQVQEAREAVRQSEAALAQSRAQLNKAFIRTPIAGTVLQLAQQEGETIAAGLAAPTVIIVADLDRLQVDAFVDETDIGQVRLGQSAEITVDAYPGHPFAGKVVKIASGATMQQNVVTYDVTISLANPSHLLKPDMTASVNIIVGRRRGTLAVPIDAIKPTPRGSTVTVMSRGKNGQPSFKVVRVRTGMSDGEHTEITEGLAEGDVVVLSGQVPGMTAAEQGPRFRGPLGFGGPPAARGGRAGGGGGR